MHAAKTKPWMRAMQRTSGQLQLPSPVGPCPLPPPNYNPPPKPLTLFNPLLLTDSIVSPCCCSATLCYAPPNNTPLGGCVKVDDGHSLAPLMQPRLASCTHHLTRKHPKAATLQTTLRQLSLLCQLHHHTCRAGTTQRGNPALLYHTASCNTSDSKVQGRHAYG